MQHFLLIFSYPVHIIIKRTTVDYMRFYEFKQKEVINIKDGTRLGYVSDFEMCKEKGHTKRLIIPGPARIFGVFGREQEYRVDWEHVKQVGDDLILIECETDKILKDLDD